jgi:L-asparagine transporter-like permease
LLLYRFNGHFNAFHVAAIVNFALIVLAIVPLLRTPRPANWRMTHYYFIAWSYVSLMSAAAINIAVRLLPLMTREQVGLTALVLSIVTMAIAYIVIGKHRPQPESPTLSDGSVGQSGATS